MVKLHDFSSDWAMTYAVGHMVESPPPPTQKKSAFQRIYVVEHNRDNQFKVSLFFSLGHLRNANTAATEAIDTTNAIPIFSYPK